VVQVAGRLLTRTRAFDSVPTRTEAGQPRTVANTRCDLGTSDVEGFKGEGGDDADADEEE